MPATVRSNPPTQDDVRGGRGASRRLARVLRERLTKGEFGPGDQLPPLRQLMQKFGVCYSVANRAMQSLVREGLVERQKGQGTFVSETPSATPTASRLDAFALVAGLPQWGFYSSLFQGVNSVAEGLHYQTIVCDTEDDIDHQATILLRLIDRRVAGIVLVPTVDPATPGDHIRPCQALGIPVVLLHRNVEGVSAPLILLPFEEIGRRVGKALIEQGHRRVACVFDERYEATIRYEAGLRSALEECGGRLPEARIFYSNRRTVTKPSEYESFLEQTLAGILGLAAEERPTAIVAFAPDAAQWIHLHLMKAGVRVPEDVSLITVDSALRQRMINAQITAVTIDELSVGRLAAQLLAEMGRNERPINNCERFTAPLDFNAGRTLGPAQPSTNAVLLATTAGNGE